VLPQLFKHIEYDGAGKKLNHSSHMIGPMGFRNPDAVHVQLVYKTVPCASIVCVQLAVAEPQAVICCGVHGNTPGEGGVGGEVEQLPGRITQFP